MNASPFFPGPRRWFGVVSVPLRVRLRVQRLVGSLADAAPLRWLGVWLGCGILLGALPVLFDVATGRSWNHWVTPLLALPLLLAAVALDSTLRGVVFLGAMLAVHCGLTIALAAAEPGLAAVLTPGGEAYWEKSERWIVTGVNPEYDVEQWLPAQAQLLAAMVFYAYVSLGLIPLWQGLYEVDLMNFYVGRLYACSENPWIVLALGWHPWSLCRGIGYLFLTFELTSLSLQGLVGMPLSTRRARQGRWLAGLTFLCLDVVIKYAALDSVRQLLASNLSVSPL